MASVNFDVVRFADGSVDMDSTLNGVQYAAIKVIEDMEKESEHIGEAVHALFDKYKGQSIAMPAIQSLVLQQLGASPENFKTLGEKVSEYLRNNSGDNAMFTIARGRNGGVSRNADKR